ncbi:MAG: Glycine cleavage system H protein [Ignavibacteriae bacterium]|nr:MAG: Glycine cleavage system H protein [Ignavibacteriota bacterium]
MNFPENLKYTKEHEWISVNGDTGVVGITDFAQSELGDVVFVELPEVGKVLKAGDIFGTIEAVKAVSDLFSPVSGTVIEVNKDLENQPELINKEPYNGGWMIKIKLSDPSELNNLLDVSLYKTLIGQ